MRNSRISQALSLILPILLPMVASAATLEVPAQYATIASALAAANAGDEVRISVGTHAEFGLVLPDGVSLVGAGVSPADCVIDGQGQGRILSAQFHTSPTVIRNLTLANGHARGETTYDASGGAIFINSSPVTLEACRFLGNSADYSGGAVRCMGAELTMSDCTFENSTAAMGGGALDLSYGASGQLARVSFLGNQAAYGGALSCRGDSNPILTDCEFDGNLARGEIGDGGGALTFFFSYPEFVRCVFRNNGASYGGAIHNAPEARANLSYCTILQNQATEGGGGVYIDNADPDIRSTLIAFQDGEGILSRGDLVPLITCTDVYGNTRGDWVGNIANQEESRGNLTVDPLFCSLELTAPPVLQFGSPCTLAGGGCDDLGALGVGCLSGVADDSDLPLPLSLELQNLGAWPNPFNPRTRIHFELGATQRVKVEVYGLDGRLVRRLADEVFGSGSQELVWNGTDEQGRAMASGPYVVLVTGETTSRKLKVTLLK